MLLGLGLGFFLWFVSLMVLLLLLLLGLKLVLLIEIVVVVVRFLSLLNRFGSVVELRSCNWFSLLRGVIVVSC